MNKASLLLAAATMSLVTILGAGCAKDSRPPCATTSVDRSTQMDVHDKHGDPITLLFVNFTFGQQFGTADSLTVIRDRDKTSLSDLPQPDESGDLGIYLPENAKIVMNGPGMQSEDCNPVFET